MRWVWLAAALALAALGTADAAALRGAGGTALGSYGGHMLAAPPAPPNPTPSYPDGSPAAPAGVAIQYPTLLNGYAARPPWAVAGVDYPVGYPASTILQDPATATLPSGCSYSSATVTCNSGFSGTIQGFDFTLHGGTKVQLTSANGATVKDNKFQLTPNCADPLINMSGSATGTLTISYNTFEGGGGTCGPLLFATIINVSLTNGSAFVAQYNLFTNVPQDVFDIAGAATGNAAVLIQFNVIHVQGFQGHPDGLQTYTRNFLNLVWAYNTYYNTNAPPIAAGTQPMHVEAAGGSIITNASVNHNTAVVLGPCNHGNNFPSGCGANYIIACKQDSDGHSNTNIGFSAYANYVDATGTVAALTNSYACQQTTWGSPSPNIDMTTGNVIPSP